MFRCSDMHELSTVYRYTTARAYSFDRVKVRVIMSRPYGGGDKSCGSISANTEGAVSREIHPAYGIKARSRF